MRNLLQRFIPALFLFLPFAACPHGDVIPHDYGNASALVTKMGNDLYQTLDTKQRGSINPQPVQLETIAAPVIVPSQNAGAKDSPRQVKVSSGFIDLANYLAHAKAIDRIQPGYFDQYVASLSGLTGSNAPLPLPNITDNRYWADSVMSDQSGYFNQIIGLALALNLSHHYLGHYDRISDKLPSGDPTPVPPLLTAAEWSASVKAGAINSLDCALGMDGTATLLEAIDKMHSRPAWAAFIVPPNTDIKKLIKQLKSYEDQYWHGKLK